MEGVNQLSYNYKALIDIFINLSSEIFIYYFLMFF